jgi:4'-phosphopantetheinyl transferase
MEKINNKKPPATGILSKPANTIHANAAKMLNLVMANSEVIDLNTVALDSLLSKSENIILARRKSTQAKKEYLASRFIIKHLTQQFVTADYSEISTVFDEQTKQLTVRLNNKPLPVTLVISHSKGWVGVYLSDRPERVGIDAEYVSSERPYLKLAKHFYHAEEVSEIENAELMYPAFYRIWTLKEALAKALAKPIAQLLAPNVYHTYAKHTIAAYCCTINNVDFSFATPLNATKPPPLVQVELSPDLTQLKQSTVNSLHHVI